MGNLKKRQPKKKMYAKDVCMHSWMCDVLWIDERGSVDVLHGCFVGDGVGLGDTPKNDSPIGDIGSDGESRIVRKLTSRRFASSWSHRRPTQCPLAPAGGSKMIKDESMMVGGWIRMSQ